MKNNRNIIISLDIETDKDMLDIDNALRRGVYAFLEQKGIAKPNKVKINYIEDLDDMFHCP